MNVDVIDDFFSEEIHKEVYHKFIKTPQWSFTGGNNSNPFWHIDGLEKDEYFNTYSMIKDFIDKTLIDAQATGYVKTYFGRQRNTSNLNSSNALLEIKKIIKV